MSQDRLDNIVFYSLEKGIKSYRQFAQRNITAANLDITIDQWLVLKTLEESPTITQQELARKVFKDLASVSRIIDLLIDKGLLHREADPMDRRKYKLTVTKAGLKLLDSVQPVIRSNREAALRGIAKSDIQKLHEIMEKIIANTLIVVLMLLSLQMQAQMPNQRRQQVISLQVTTRDIRREVVDSLARTLLANYVFRDTAARMGNYIRLQLSNGLYDKLTDPNEFAQALTNDLRSVYNDKHMSVLFSPHMESMLLDTSGSDKSGTKEETARESARENFGFRKAEILDGNIGYLKFNEFFSIDSDSKATVDNAFGFLRNTDAMVIDVRHNGGGDPEMVEFICSHLLPAKTHINDLYERRTGKTTEFWTDSLTNPANIYTKPVYILTSRRTFSAAEEFSYDLQTRHRAVIVGEITGGGANPVEPRTLSNGFIGRIPWGRAVNPITHGNWEAVGVWPDLAVGSDSALDAALLTCYNDRIKHATDSNDARLVIWAREMLLSREYPMKVDTAHLKALVANFGVRALFYKNGSLYYVNHALGYETKLVPLSAYTFKAADDDSSKYELEVDSHGQLAAMSLVRDDGTRVRYLRTR
jgi:DNA-binding MarR family transcriptional regulator